MGNYHAGFGEEGACFLPEASYSGVAARSYSSDRSVGRKIRIYIGPASDARSRRRASTLEGRYRAVQEVKDRLLLHVSRFTVSQALSNSADAATERLAILKELENLAAAVEE